MGQATATAGSVDCQHFTETLQAPTPFVVSYWMLENRAGMAG